ncbi:unnamed protein product [Ascophyllum nodosum]
MIGILDSPSCVEAHHGHSSCNSSCNLTGWPHGATSACNLSSII